VQYLFGLDNTIDFAVHIALRGMESIAELPVFNNPVKDINSYTLYSLSLLGNITVPMMNESFSVAL